MAFNDAQKLQSYGVATPLALELIRQITANTGDTKKLQELGLGSPQLCDYVATSITTGPMNAVQATRLDMDSVLAPVLTAMVNA